MTGFRMLEKIEATNATARAEDAHGPFKAFPSGLHDHLRPFFDDITEEVVRAIRTEIPEYARPTDDTYMQVVHQGC
ncbi:hypothetical protein ACRJ4W_06480 [Streptomyces sp. GLT-R25]